MDENESFGRLISILYRQGSIYFHRKIGPYGLGHGQIPVLMYVVTKENVTQHQISEHFQLDKGSTSNLIKSLEKNGFIRKRQDQHDRRSYWLSITDKTRKLLPELKVIFKEWTRVLTNDFNDKEKDMAYKLLNRMIENSREYLKNKNKNER
jgi:DNA-binding MarR family transcriptional regulator